MSKAKFWNKIAKSYAKQKIADEESYQVKLKKTQEYLTPEMDILEFGCGTGTTAIIHAPFVRHILASDISQNMIEIAKEKAADKAVENVDFTVADIESLDVEAESKDAVLGMSILHLLKDKEAAMKKVHTMLKPGGLFISSTVCMGGGISFWKPIIVVGNFFGLLPFVSFFGKEELVQALQAAGFQIEYEWQPGKKKAVFIIAGKV